METAPHVKHCPLTLAAIGKCCNLRSLLIDGGKARSVQQVPSQWATALTALSSLWLKVELPLSFSVHPPHVNAARTTFS